MLVPPNRLLERIMLYGGPGSGKTHAYMTIAHLMNHYGSPGKMRVIESDIGGASRVRDLVFPGLDNVEIVPCEGWKDYEDTLDKFRAASQPHDWIVVDLACRSWDECQESYSQAIYKKDLADHMLAERKKHGGGAIDQAGWGVIKSMYRGWVRDLFLRPKCHVLVCNTADQLGEKENALTRSTFDWVGQKPAGEKKFAHHPDSVFYLQMRRGSYWIQTIKDRGRRKLDQELQYFASEYLMGVCGWVAQ